MARIYRFSNGFEGTMEDYLFTFESENVVKIQEDNAMSNYKRSLFNRKNHEEQAVYITRLFKRKIHTVWLKDGRIYEVPKKVFDTFMDIYTDAHLFGGEAHTPFDVSLKYDVDYESASKAWLKY